MSEKQDIIDKAIGEMQINFFSAVATKATETEKMNKEISDIMDKYGFTRDINFFSICVLKECYASEMRDVGKSDDGKKMIQTFQDKIETFAKMMATMAGVK